MRTLLVSLALCIALAPSIRAQSCSATQQIDRSRLLRCDNQRVTIEGTTAAPVLDARFASHTASDRETVTLSISTRSKGGWNFQGVDRARLVWPSDTLTARARRGETQVRNAKFFEQVVVTLAPHHVQRVRRDRPTHLAIRGAKIHPDVLASQLSILAGL